MLYFNPLTWSTSLHLVFFYQLILFTRKQEYFKVKDSGLLRYDVFITYLAQFSVGQTRLIFWTTGIEYCQNGRNGDIIGIVLFVDSFFRLLTLFIILLRDEQAYS